MVEMMDDEIVVEVVDDLIEIEILAGEKGETGAKGDPGETGPEGPQGERGPQGIPGADGVGIALIAKVGSSGLVDTYLITLTNGVGYTFEVTNGASIASIIKTGSSGLTDTYTITLTNGDTSTFEVTNGAKGEKGDTGPQGPQGPRGAGITSIEKIGSEGLVDTYRIMYSDGYSLTYTVTNGAKGDTGPQGPQGETGPQGPQGPRGVGITDIVKIGSEGLVDTYRIYYSDGYTLTYTVTNGEKGEKGDTGPEGPQGPQGPAGPRTYTVWGEIDGYIANQTDLQNALNGKADTNHAHGDLYYSKTETDTKLAGKSDTGHTHDDLYYTESEVDKLLEEKAASAHKHGNMYNDTSFPSDTAVANGDKLIIADSSANGKMARSGISFDGATTNRALTPKGTWGAFAAANHNHDSAYAAKDHNHDERYYTESEMDTALSEKAALDHGHGNLGNGGVITGNVGIGNGDCLVVSDYSNSDKLTCTNVKFDGLDTDKGLTPKGTWEPFAKQNHNHDGVYAAADHNHDDLYYTEDEINTKLNAKQDALTFDTAPTTGSGNPVTSGGVKTALDEKEDALTFDTVPTEGSGNPVTSGGVKTALDSKENTIIKTATGAIASFDDGVEAPAAHVVAKIEPVQDLHGYEHPWPAGGGKNLLPMTVEDMQALNTTGTWSGNAYTHNGITFTVLTDGMGNVIGVSTSGTATDRSDFRVCQTKANTLVEDIQYRLSGSRDGSINSWVIWMEGHGSIVSEMSTIGDGIFTASSSDKSYRKIVTITVFGGYEPNLIFEPMIRLASETDATFEPYSNVCPISGWTGVNVTVSPVPDAQDGTTYSITFPSSVGTVYGGELDVTTGVLTVDRAMVTYDGSSDEYWRIAPSDVSAKFLIDNPLCPNNPIPTEAKSSCFKYISSNPWNTDNTIWLRYKQTHVNPDSNIVPSGITNEGINEFKTWLSTNNIQVVFPLATPITYQLTPTEVTTLLGQNNIWADTGDITVDYQYDINKALGEKADNTKITDNIESASQATRNYTAGSLAIVQNQLLRITQNIATGGAITIGNNAEAIDLETLIAEKAEKILVAKLPFLSSAELYNNTADYHNAMPRGKDITAYFTDGSLWSRINGTNGYSLFEDLYVGDYLTAGGQQYMIVDFDYYIRCGDSHDLNQHHLVMMPVGNMSIPEGTVLYNTDTSAEVQTLELINTANAGVTVTSQETAVWKKWNASMDAPDTHTTAGGYKYSRMRQVIMKAADTIVRGAFGADHVKPIDVLYPNPADAAASGTVSAWTWFKNTDWNDDLRMSICDLPNEVQIYGSMVFALRGFEVGIDKWQFSLFRYDRRRVNIRSYWWLRSVSSAASACCVDSNGYANSYGSAFAFGVRPRFVLVG